ncbi:TetR/AcrR family transcriptional regulator [Treponema sp.]|uniref:TetR/AcrR family transcriptional regulator n=1 Tax=Treponema sp. TaxID=166 RepID=UPI002580DBA2|nr:TetR/AcrR family transcriptional regulator [Treponema sp.]
MSCETKEQIIETALELFSQNGFLGTSMSDIASQLKITKGALYKHYESKQQILEQIIERMAKLDLERAKKYEMPETEQKKFAEAYIHIPTEKNPRVQHCAIQALDGRKFFRKVPQNAYAGTVPQQGNV